MVHLFYRGDQEALKRRIYLDRRKKRLCKENGVRLICVPQLDDELLLKDLKDFVLGACAKLGIRIAKVQRDVDPDYAKAFQPIKTDWIERLRVSAGRRRGSCLSQKWIGWREKYSFVCERVHTWQATAGSILHQGSWCKRCASAAKNGRGRPKDSRSH